MIVRHERGGTQPSVGEPSLSRLLQRPVQMRRHEREPLHRGRAHDLARDPLPLPLPRVVLDPAVHVRELGELLAESRRRDGSRTGGSALHRSLAVLPRLALEDRASGGGSSCASWGLVDRCSPRCQSRGGRVRRVVPVAGRLGEKRLGGYSETSEPASTAGEEAVKIPRGVERRVEGEWVRRGCCRSVRVG